MSDKKSRILAAVQGFPKAQPRVRIGKRGAYTPNTGVQQWKDQIKLAIASNVPEEPWQGPIMVSMTFWVARPKRLMRKMEPDEEMWHTQKPDIDNLAKAVLDACTEQRVWGDDDQVCFLWVKKYWMEKEGTPGMFLAIKPMEDEKKEREDDELVVQLP